MCTLLPRPIFGQDMAIPDVTGRGSGLRLRVYASGGTGDAYVRQVVDVARDLLTRGGVDTEWGVCVAAACPRDQLSAATVVVILEGSGQQGQGNYCGRVALGDVAGWGTVRVSVPCVASVAARLQQRWDSGAHPLLTLPWHHDLTGAVVAHEIGHVLGLQHGPAGVMRKTLDRSDILSLREDRLAFSEADAVMMRRSAARVAGSTPPVLALRR
jgi:hypothetical protein